MKNTFLPIFVLNLKTGQPTAEVALVVENGRFVEITSTPGEGETLSLNGGFVL